MRRLSVARFASQLMKKRQETINVAKATRLGTPGRGLAWICRLR